MKPGIYKTKLDAAKGVFWGLIFGSAFWLVIILLLVEAIEHG